MTHEASKRNIAVRIVLRAAKLPSIYALIGTILTCLSYIDDLLHFSMWKRVFDISSNIGNIFFALTFLTFFYNLVVMSCSRIEKNLDKNQQITALVLSNLRKGLRIIFLLVAINVAIILASPSPFYLMLANNIINTIIIGSIGWIATQIFYTCEAVLFQQMMRLPRHESLRAKALYTKLHIIRNIATVVIMTITIAAILMSFHSVRNIGISLLASAGFITALVGLAAQKTLFSLFAGLQIALSQIIKIGDVVLIENTTGTIEEITFTYVTLKLSDCRRLILPINHFIDKPFQNWSQDNTSFKDTITLYVDYLMPIEPLREHMNTVIQNSPFWDGHQRKLTVSKFTENAVEITIQFTANTHDDLGELRAEVREKMAEFIRDNFPTALPRRRSVMATPDQNTTPL